MSIHCCVASRETIVSKAVESEIGRLVYELYGLTKEEILVVEGGERV
jgi:hypothetical protein